MIEALDFGDSIQLENSGQVGGWSREWALVHCRVLQDNQTREGGIGTNSEGGAIAILVEWLEWNEAVRSCGSRVDGDVNNEVETLDAIDVANPGSVDGNIELGVRCGGSA